MLNFLKQQLMFEVLKHSVKRNIKQSAKKAKEKYNDSNFKKRIDKIKEKYEKSEVKEIVNSTTVNLNKKFNETKYYLKNGEAIKFKKITLTYVEAFDLLSLGEYKMEDGLIIKISDNKECFTAKTYFLRKTSVIFLIKEHFYKNEDLEIKLI